MTCLKTHEENIEGDHCLGYTSFTGKAYYLNLETMKVVEEVEKGINVTTYAFKDLWDTPQEDEAWKDL